MKTCEMVEGKLVEIDPGLAGTYEIRDGKRVRVQAPGEPHKDGERPRHADGSPVDKPLIETEPALPKAGPAPWDTPAEPAASKNKASRTEPGAVSGKQGA